MSITLNLEGNRAISIKKGTTLQEVLKITGDDENREIMAAFLDNKMRELSHPLEQDGDVKFVGLNSLDGIRVYQRSASFILIKAVHELAPQANIKILHPIANGLYVEIENGPHMNSEFVKSIEARMREIVAQDLPFTREEVPIDDAIRRFRDNGKNDKARLLSYRNSKVASIYRLGDLINYFYGYLAPSTGYIKIFSLQPYDQGLILQLPTIMNPTKLTPAKKNKKLYEVFKETRKWRSILNVDDVGMLNEVIRAGNYTEFVLIAEAFHEKKIAQIADKISARKDTKIILISGPSASGKTTFTKRLAIQLRVNGLKPLLISMDDYFLDRDKTPKAPSGEHDFESPYAINIELFQENLKAIIENREVELPHYDFKTGKAVMTSGHKIVPDDQSVVLIEGIHGLNPLFSTELPQNKIFKIYVSPLTEVPLDSHNRVPTTDTRILRRIIRDHQFRNYSAKDTILRWPSVKEGEVKHIFPHQEEADVFFNTALIYEFAALKSLVEPVLEQVPHESTAYGEAVRLLKFLSYFLPIPVEVVPRHSILREFLGNSSFKY